jgi:disulfide bond formation protein DsbB
MPGNLPTEASAQTLVAGSTTSQARERTAVIAALTLSAASIAGMAALAVAVGWSQKQITVGFATEPENTFLNTTRVVHGREMFATVCIACHGEDGRGRPGLGKDLTASPFVKANTDPMLRQMIKEGRAASHVLNTTKVAMPPRGGNDKLTDGDIDDIVLFMRALQDPTQVARNVSLVAKAPEPTEAEVAAAAGAALAAAGGDAELAEYIASGTKLYAATCIACHGAGGVGMKGNGKALVNNEFVQGLNDDDLLAFIKKGRDPGDPKNTTGVGMPAKGGNPALSEDDLLDIISYLRTLQPAEPAESTASK